MIFSESFPCIYPTILFFFIFILALFSFFYPFGRWCEAHSRQVSDLLYWLCVTSVNKAYILDYLTLILAIDFLSYSVMQHW